MEGQVLSSRGKEVSIKVLSPADLLWRVLSDGHIIGLNGWFVDLNERGECVNGLKIGIFGMRWVLLWKNFALAK